MCAAVGSSGHGFAVFDDDRPVVSVDEGVVASTQQHPVVDLGRAALVPRLTVVDIAPGRWPVTPGEHAAAVLERDGSADARRALLGEATDVEHLTAAPSTTRKAGESQLAIGRSAVSSERTTDGGPIPVRR
jgi:hypothetical protein